MNDLSFAILFEELYIDELQFPVYIPIRPIIGYSNKKSELFISYCIKGGNLYDISF